jgi:histidyl-tRNA synthetase
VSNRAEPIRSVKGTRDLLPRDMALWQRVEDEARRVFAAYNFSEIRTPIFEQTALFARSVGEETDIVTKEMYRIEERSPRELEELKYRILNQPVTLDNVRTVYEFKKDVEDIVQKIKIRFDTGETPRSPQNERAIGRIGNLLAEYDTSLGAALTWDKATTDRFYACCDAIRAAIDEITFVENLTLRPEATASVVRAYIEHSMANEGGIHKLYYIGPMFRRERPQKGRYRQFYQIGAEVLGSDHPTIDAEFLEMLVLLLTRVGITEYQLLLNSVGCPKCRPQFVETLRQALDKVKDQMCSDCQRRAVTNPLRVLDCKVEADQPIIEKLPHIIDHLCAECRAHFDHVTRELGERGVQYVITPRLVRGLDYYTRTTFEMTSSVLGAQNAFLGGGRYDGLSEMIGGPPTPGFGVAIGEDRLLLMVEQAGTLKADGGIDVFVAWLGETAERPAAQLARALREQGLSVEANYENAKLKKSLGQASKLGARFTVIIGEGELASGRYQVKDMAAAQQVEVERNQITYYLKEKLQKGSH